MLTSPDYKEDSLAFERLTFFSDAVIAIAITLLAIEIRLPEISSPGELGHALLALWPRYLSFAISFLAIGSYWMAHQRMFTYIRRVDRVLILLNFIFLALVAFMPFPTGVVGEYGNRPLGQVFYAVSVAVAGLAKAGLWYYAAHNHRLIDADLSPDIIQEMNFRSLVIPLAFLASIPLAFVNFVLPIIVWWLSPIVYAVLMRVRAARMASNDGG